MSWEPILDEPLRTTALETISSIAQELKNLSPRSPSLADGDAGLAIFFAYLAEVFQSSNHAAIAVEKLERAVASANDRAADLSLYSGIVGIAWAMEHLRSLFSMDDIDPIRRFDQSLLSALSHPWGAGYDLVTGLVGVGVYAFARYPLTPALERCVLLLNQIGQFSEGEVTWKTPARELEVAQSENRVRVPEYNLGMAHGVPGVIAFLAQAIRVNAAPDIAIRLLRGAVTWLLNHQLPSSSDSAFSYYGDGPRSQSPARTAWCYGDPGVALAILSAARAAREPSWEQLALAWARKAARRPVEDTGVFDTGICHGSAGLALLFSRLFFVTGESIFRDAARFWVERTLFLRQAGKPVAGFPSWGGPDSGWLPDPGILNGSAGVGLALLAASSSSACSTSHSLVASSSFLAFLSHIDSYLTSVCIGTANDIPRCRRRFEFASISEGRPRKAGRENRQLCCK